MKDVILKRTGAETMLTNCNMFSVNVLVYEIKPKFGNADKIQLLMD